MNEHETRKNGAQDHLPDTGTDNRDNASEIINDGLFTIKVSEDMTLRNNLRRGLVEAQGKNLDRIPLFVSWPHWLDDGIVCLYAKDLHQVLHDTVQQTALAFKSEFGIDIIDETPVPFEDALRMETPPQSSAPDTEAVYTSSSGTPADANVDTESPPATPDTITPAPAPKKPAPPSQQDVADQLFEELKKGKRD